MFAETLSLMGTNVTQGDQVRICTQYPLLVVRGNYMGQSYVRESKILDPVSLQVCHDLVPVFVQRPQTLSIGINLQPFTDKGNVYTRTKDS
jgi:hypothetical protein